MTAYEVTLCVVCSRPIEGTSLLAGDSAEACTRPASPSISPTTRPSPWSRRPRCSSSRSSACGRPDHAPKEPTHMLVPLTTQDFLARGATVYPERVAVVDEPDQPAGEPRRSSPSPSCRRAHERSPPASTRMGIAAGERIAVVSQNSARMLDLFYGATASGASWCRSTSASGATRSTTSSATATRRCCSSIPSSSSPLAGVRAPRRLTLGRRVRRRAAALRRRAAALDGRRRERDRDDQLHERHDRAAEGRASSRTATSGSTPR